MTHQKTPEISVAVMRRLPIECSSVKSSTKANLPARSSPDLVSERFSFSVQSTAMNNLRLSLQPAGRRLLTVEFLRRLILAPFARLLSWKGLVWSKAGYAGGERDSSISSLRSFRPTCRWTLPLFIYLFKGCRNRVQMICKSPLKCFFACNASSPANGPHANRLGRMLRAVAFLSPSAIQALLRTSTDQVSNRITGVAVSLIKQSDVKNHLSSRHRTRIHLATPASQPDATGFSEEQSERTDPLIEPATEGSLPEAGIAAPAVCLLVNESELGPVEVPVTSKSSQA